MRRARKRGRFPCRHVETPFSGTSQRYGRAADDNGEDTTDVGAGARCRQAGKLATKNFFSLGPDCHLTVGRNSCATYPGDGSRFPVPVSSAQVLRTHVGIDPRWAGLVGSKVKHCRRVGDVGIRWVINCRGRMGLTGITSRKRLTAPKQLFQSRVVQLKANGERGSSKRVRNETRTRKFAVAVGCLSGFWGHIKFRVAKF